MHCTIRGSPMVGRNQCNLDDILDGRADAGADIARMGIKTGG